MERIAQRSAVYLAVAGLSLGLSTPAFAQPADEQPVEEPISVTDESGAQALEVPADMLNLVNYDATGSITVNKSTATQAERGDGNILDPAPGPALEGVTFELYKVMDIDNAADFQDASGYTAEDAPAGELIGTQVTGADGKVTFGNLDVGLYRVVETDAPEGVAMAAPYLVYVPMTNPANLSEWNYDVQTYPKNSESETTKTVEDADANVGDEITYTIESDIPVVTENDVTQYEVHDQLDAANVQTSPEQISVTVDGQDLIQGTDFDLTVSADQKVEISFLQPGLDKLTAAKLANAGAKVVTTIGATVLEIADSDGVATNEATVFHNNPYDVSKTEERPSGEVETYWAKLRVLKTGTDGQPLEGAEFEVYRCTEANGLGEQISIDHDADPATPAIDTWTTDAEGNLVIDGLHVTDIENNDQEIAKSYCLVETKAPEGYELLTDPVVVTLNTGDLEQLEGDTAPVSQQTTVENVTSNSVKLPLTGGMGIGIFAALGALIIGAGAYAARRNKA